MAADILLMVLGILVSPRTLESWPLKTKLVNGHATVDTGELLAVGRAKLDESPSIRGGRSRQAA